MPCGCVAGSQVCDLICECACHQAVSETPHIPYYQLAPLMDSEEGRAKVLKILGDIPTTQMLPWQMDMLIHAADWDGYLKRIAAVEANVIPLRRKPA